MLRPELAPPASPCNKIETVFLLMPNINNMSCNLCDFSYWLGNSNKACLNQFTRSFSKSMFFNAHLDWHRDFVTILLLSKEGIGNNQTHLRSISSIFSIFLYLSAFVSISQYFSFFSFYILTFRLGRLDLALLEKLPPLLLLLLSTIDKVGATFIPKRITVELDDMKLADTAPLP